MRRPFAGTLSIDPSELSSILAGVNTLRIDPPLYLLKSTTECYKCGAIVPAVALACFTLAERGENDAAWDKPEELGELLVVSDLAEIPPEILQQIHRVHRTFERRFSKMANATYWMNTCSQCGAHFGDHFLHADGGGAFFPVNESEAARIMISKLDCSGPVEMSGAYGIGAGDLIWKCGTKDFVS